MQYITCFGLRWTWCPNLPLLYKLLDLDLAIFIPITCAHYAPTRQSKPARSRSIFILITGACYAPTEIYATSILLTHWGRKDLDHTSNTGWDPDNYSAPLSMPGYQEADWREIIKGHACYTPGEGCVLGQGA